MRAFASLRRQSEFERLRRRGRRTMTDALTLFRGEASPAGPRSVVGITVGKTVGIAVVRNRTRRRLAAIAHELLADAAPMRLLIVARPAAAAASFSSLREQLARALR